MLNVAPDVNTRYDSLGIVNTMSQPTSIPDFANKPISASGTNNSQYRALVGVSKNIELFDNSFGQSGQITGETASIKFTRANDLTRYFLFQKRAGSIINNDNVIELFPTKSYPGSSNYIFIGRSGVSSDSTKRNTGNITLSSNIDTTKAYAPGNGTFLVEISTNGAAPTYNSIFSGDARIVWVNSFKSGVVSYLNGSGTDGYAGLAYNGLSYIYVDSIGLKLGGSLIPDTNNSYNVGSASAGIAKFFLNGGAFITSGTGVPNGVVSAPIGSLYLRLDGGSNLTLYVKESGTGNSGWASK